MFVGDHLSLKLIDQFSVVSKTYPLEWGTIYIVFNELPQRLDAWMMFSLMTPRLWIETGGVHKLVFLFHCLTFLSLLLFQF